ncbi:hypothetical protein VNO78_22754 [Psophocarpus tetragonolobus]|uniref:Uncharacterized protein n=1 Tax=Psophocarpus tetragonolobus TaxID=3891 RepID=A0AAN9S256_PSOTE
MSFKVSNDFRKHVNIAFSCSRHLVWSFFSGFFCTLILLCILCSLRYAFFVHEVINLIRTLAGVENLSKASAI